MVDGRCARSCATKNRWQRAMNCGSRDPWEATRRRAGFAQPHVCVGEEACLWADAGFLEQGYPVSPGAAHPIFAPRSVWNFATGFERARKRRARMKSWPSPITPTGRGGRGSARRGFQRP